MRLGGQSATAREVKRQWPRVGAFTALMILAPLAVLAVLPTAVSFGDVVLVALSCTLCSLLVAQAGSWMWRRTHHSNEFVFADLMLWNWLRRLYSEHRLQQTYELVERSLMHPESMPTAERLKVLERMAQLVEARDSYTQRHSRRVARHSTGIGRKLRIPADQLADIRTAAALHDVGKICTPRSVLTKPAGLTDREFEIIKRHPTQGADLIKGLVAPEVEAMVRHHHERLEGTGYPDGLVGDEIPMGARIIAVADTFDAMTSSRAYRAGMPHQQALDVLRASAG